MKIWYDFISFYIKGNSKLSIIIWFVIISFLSPFVYTFFSGIEDDGVTVSKLGISFHSGHAHGCFTLWISSVLFLEAEKKKKRSWELLYTRRTNPPNEYLWQHPDSPWERCSRYSQQAWSVLGGNNPSGMYHYLKGERLELFMCTRSGIKLKVEKNCWRAFI